MNLIRRFTGEWHVSFLKTWGLWARTPEEVFMLLLLSSGHWMVSSNCYFTPNRWVAVVAAAAGCCGYGCYCVWGLDGCRHLALSWHAKPPCLSYKLTFSLWLWLLSSIFDLLNVYHGGKYGWQKREEESIIQHALPPWCHINSWTTWCCLPLKCGACAFMTTHSSILCFKSVKSWLEM